jgi:hypothetical protein
MFLYILLFAGHLEVHSIFRHSNIRLLVGIYTIYIYLYMYLAVVPLSHYPCYILVKSPLDGVYMHTSRSYTYIYICNMYIYIYYIHSIPITFPLYPHELYPIHIHIIPNTYAWLHGSIQGWPGEHVDGQAEDGMCYLMII